MGLIGGLLTLPLAPVRGVAWVFDQVMEEAEAQYYDPARIRAEIGEAEAALERGEIDEETYEALERELLDRLLG
jgi:chorismate mutase